MTPQDLSALELSHAAGQRRSARRRRTYAQVALFNPDPTGHGRFGFADSTDTLLTDAGYDPYCNLPDGCECPLDRPGAGTQFADLPAGTPLHRWITDPCDPAGNRR